MKNDFVKLFWLEREHGETIDMPRYRFLSRVNGCKGLWRDSRERAHDDGMIHQALWRQCFEITEDELWNSIKRESGDD